MKKKSAQSDTRPWGKYEVLFREKNTLVKRIEIKPKSRFSLQKHFKRAEKWIIVAGRGIATMDSARIKIKAGSFLDIKKGQVHRLENTGLLPLVLVEVQFGNYLGEDDIVRYQDDFGRK